jgi:hypothetical protein
VSSAADILVRLDAILAELHEPRAAVAADQGCDVATFKRRATAGIAQQHGLRRGNPSKLVR